MDLEQVLERVATGMATAADAEWLRQVLAQRSVRAVAESRVQFLVMSAVAERGYAAHWRDEQFAARQVVKALEELGELGAAFILPDAISEVLREVGKLARAVFDDGRGWEHCRVEDWETVATELADVVIPLLCLAEAVDVDVLAVVQRKVVEDVRRGVRE